MPATMPLIIKETAPAKGTRGNDRHQRMMSAITRCFNNDKYADVTIYLGHVKLPAHGMVLSAQSVYFETALKSVLKEGTQKKFEFAEGSMHAYWRVFQYMYTGEYNEDAATSLSSVVDDDELTKDVRVYQLAEYFGTQSLKDYALNKFEAKIQKLWVTETFIDCIADIYDSTNDYDCKMRRLLVTTVKKHLRELWENRRFRDLILGGGDFVLDVLAEFID